MLPGHSVEFRAVASTYQLRQPPGVGQQSTVPAAPTVADRLVGDLKAGAERRCSAAPVRDSGAQEDRCESICTPSNSSQ
jgi:hypothetical protein